ncbi:MAG: stage II sporulation protein R [Oscillospiraceae bacterium]
MKINLKKIELSLLCGLIIATSLSLTSFSATCDNVRGDVLRMHIIANSDTPDDQALKLKVRDAVLTEGKDIFGKTLTSENAQELLLPRIDSLKESALKVIHDNGYNYDVKVQIGKDFFSTRTYDDKITLPAGTYEAVKVIIGEGCGQNWWCVMFPPMCLPAAEGNNDEIKIDDVLSENEANVVKSSPKFEPRFKIIEIYEKIVEKFK